MEKKSISDLLQNNPYPGRGLIFGRSADNCHAVLAYFIMGRSENSRNRIFVATEDGIRTEARDASKMTDPSLIIYHPLRVFEGKTIVTNGDQTETIRDNFAQGHCYRHALLTREFEPDGPNFTPRISGVLKPDCSFVLSILKSADGDPACCCRYFYEYDAPIAGEGRFLHTYQGDGNPLPSFEGEPLRIGMDAATPENFADTLWSALNESNKVSLFVRYVSRSDGSVRDIIRNKT